MTHWWVLISDWLYIKKTKYMQEINKSLVESFKKCLKSLEIFLKVNMTSGKFTFLLMNVITIFFRIL